MSEHATRPLTHAELLRQPLPDDVAGCHAMILQLRVLLDEHRASFGDLDERQAAARAANLKAGFMAAWPVGLRAMAGNTNVIRPACRVLIFLADVAQTGGGRFVASDTLSEAAVYSIGEREFPSRCHELARIKVAVANARKLLQGLAPHSGRGDLENMYGVGYRLHPRAARAVLDLEALGARAVAG